MKKDDISIEPARGRLTISGERKREMKDKKDNWYRSEREVGSFLRAISLPEGTKIDDIKAIFSDGVLELSMPLSAKKIPAGRKVKVEEPAPAAKKKRLREQH